MEIIFLNIAFLFVGFIGLTAGFIAFFEAKYIEFKAGKKSEYFVRKGEDYEE